MSANGRSQEPLNSVTCSMDSSAARHKAHPECERKFPRANDLHCGFLQRVNTKVSVPNRVPRQHPRSFQRFQDLHFNAKTWDVAPMYVFNALT